MTFGMYAYRGSRIKIWNEIVLGIQKLFHFQFRNDILWERPPVRDKFFRSREAAPTWKLILFKLEMELHP